MSRNPLVSVIINCHNGESYIKKSIKSVLFQDYKNWEIIFWDNCSTDKSKNKLKEFKDKRIKYYHSSKFNTLYKSRNLAIKKAKGKYLSFLDVDDIWKKNKLTKQVRKLEKFKCKFIYTNYFINNRLNKKQQIRTNKKLPEGFVTQKILNDYVVGINTVMIKKDIFKHYKFNENYNIIGDLDLFMKLSLKYKFLSIQKPLVIYNIHGKNLSIEKIKFYIRELTSWIEINEKKIFKKFDLKNLKYFLFKLKLKKIINNIPFLTNMGV